MGDLRVYSPVVEGSGVIVLHEQLAQAIPDYSVRRLPPEVSFFPPLLALLDAPAVPVTHATPDLGPWLAHRDSALVATFHGYYLDAGYLAAAPRLKRLFYQRIMRPAMAAALRRAHLATAVSAFTASLIQRDWGLGERLTVIRNGVDTARFTPPDSRRGRPAVKILFSGNPIGNKGFGDVLALAEMLPPQASIHYTRGMRRSARASVPELPGLVGMERVPHARMPEIYRDCDILLLPTIREGLSLAVLEAMACGMPVVATDCASLPEQIVHGKGGFLFQRGNRHEMLGYLQRLIESPGLREEMGAFNRERVLREFSQEQMVRSYREVFAQAAGRG
ncbi:MAG TPA: glycosyltransferase family 4 protein [Moraxellaceae bacterium]